jgi:hypothetical protein
MVEKSPASKKATTTRYANGNIIANAVSDKMYLHACKFGMHLRLRLQPFVCGNLYH